MAGGANIDMLCTSQRLIGTEMKLGEANDVQQKVSDTLDHESETYFTLFGCADKGKIRWLHQIVSSPQTHMN